MNNFYLSIILSSLIVAGLFIGSVMINLNVKSSKQELKVMLVETEKLKRDIKRQQIEISALTNPYYVMDYINKHDLKSVTLTRKIKIYIDK
jgi:cell division protein FtsL